MPRPISQDIKRCGDDVGQVAQAGRQVIQGGFKLGEDDEALVIAPLSAAVKMLLDQLDGTVEAGVMPRN